MHAVLDEKGLLFSNAFMICFAGFYITISIALIKIAGTVGLVLADSIKMAGRIAFALWSSLPRRVFCLAELLL